jgi:S-adenosylmethionine-diacylglycerol 3-amino-3-carboxypropyl transferase
MSQVVNYSQCWEDAETLLRGLDMTAEDDVLSITSGGDNTFALLLSNPRSITAIDHNPAQTFLADLKIQAIRRLDYDDFIGFVGAAGCAYRGILYRHLRSALSPAARAFWDSRPDDIDRGIIHCGRFERYLGLFRRGVLPLIHAPATVRHLLTQNGSDEQVPFYEQVWDSRRWRWLFRTFFSRLLLARLGRHPEVFRHVEQDAIGSLLLERTRRGLTDVPLRDNYFAEFILTGHYRDLPHAHPWLRQEHFATLKERVSRVTLVTGDFASFLARQQEGSLSKLNLSDIFEYVSDAEYEALLSDLLRVIRPGGRIGFWTLFIPRDVPPTLRDSLHIDAETCRDLSASDRTFFYGGFRTVEVRSPSEAAGRRRPAMTAGADLTSLGR